MTTVDDTHNEALEAPRVIEKELARPESVDYDDEEPEGSDDEESDEQEEGADPSEEDKGKGFDVDDVDDGYALLKLTMNRIATMKATAPPPEEDEEDDEEDEEEEEGCDDEENPNDAERAESMEHNDEVDGTQGDTTAVDNSLEGSPAAVGAVAASSPSDVAMDNSSMASPRASRSSDDDDDDEEKKDDSHHHQQQQASPPPQLHHKMTNRQSFAVRQISSPKPAMRRQNSAPVKSAVKPRKKRDENAELWALLNASKARLGHSSQSSLTTPEERAARKAVAEGGAPAADPSADGGGRAPDQADFLRMAAQKAGKQVVIDDDQNRRQQEQQKRDLLREEAELRALLSQSRKRLEEVAAKEAAKEAAMSDDVSVMTQGSVSSNMSFRDDASVGSAGAAFLSFFGKGGGGGDDSSVVSAATAPPERKKKKKMNPYRAILEKLRREHKEEEEEENEEIEIGFEKSEPRPLSQREALIAIAIAEEASRSGKESFEMNNVSREQLQRDLDSFAFMNEDDDEFGFSYLQPRRNENGVSVTAGSAHPRNRFGRTPDATTKLIVGGLSVMKKIKNKLREVRERIESIDRENAKNARTITYH